MDLLPAAGAIGGLAGLFAVAAALIWRLVRLGTEQEERLLRPAYERIDALEERILALEAENRRCQRRLALAFWTLRSNGIPVPEEVT